MNHYTKRDKCGICGNKDLQVVLEYGEVPLAGYFPTDKEKHIEKKFNLNLLFCPKCTLVQTDSVIDPDVLFKDYRYLSSVGLTRHFTEVANILKQEYHLDGNSRVLEIGSNDGVLQAPMRDLGVNVIGIEPAINIAKLAKERGLTVINDYFNDSTITNHITKQSIDLIIANNCFAHINDLHSIMRGIKYCLKPGGNFVIEVHYLKELIHKLQYDNVYHEHIYYYSECALANLVTKYGMTITMIDYIQTHAGSMRVYIENEMACESQVEKWSKYEQTFYYKNMLKNFTEDVKKHSADITKTLSGLKRSGAKIVGYGASGRANMLCNVCKLGPEIIDYIIDESPERQNRYIAGRHIPIYSKNVIDTDKVDYVFIFAWNYANMIIDKLQNKGCKFIVGFPKLQIVSDSSQLDFKGSL